MGQTRWLGIAALVSAIALSGCMGSPTYGTGKTANEQLLEDVTGILDLAPKNGEPIEYKPRPQLVTPADAAGLPPPQENVVDMGSPAWPESPEAARARLRADATANRDEPGYQPKIKGPEVEDGRSAAMADRNPNFSSQAMLDTDDEARKRARSRPEADRSRAQMDRNPNLSAVETDPNRSREEFNRRLAASRQGSPETRRYLSEPPLDYRAPAETAPVNDIGVDEEKKERQRKAASRKKGSTSWRDFVPWL